MPIRDILALKGSLVWTIGPQATLMSAVEELERRGIAALIVVADDKIEGVISEREVVQAIARHADGFARMLVSDAMRRDTHALGLDDRVTTAMALMTQKRARHLPVVDNGRLVGLISIGDAVKSRLDDLETETRVLRDMTVAAR